MLLLVAVLTIVLGAAVYTAAPDHSQNMNDYNGSPQLTATAPGQTLGYLTAKTIHFSDFSYSDEYDHYFENSDKGKGYVYNSKEGDTIVCLAGKNMIDSGKISFDFVPGKGVTWWKGLSLVSSDGSVFKQAEFNNVFYPNNFHFEIYTTDLKDKTLVLSKAKTLGVHTAVYAFADTETSFVGGYGYLFEWIKE
jgi:hypothetical protein